jgi:hypothetical protein
VRLRNRRLWVIHNNVFDDSSVVEHFGIHFDIDEYQYFDDNHVDHD